MNKRNKHIPLIGDGLKKYEYDILAYTQTNDYEGVKAALNDDPRSIRQIDDDGMDALHWAICNNNTAIAELLLRFKSTLRAVPEKPTSSLLDRIRNADDKEFDGIYKIDFSRRDAFGREYGQLALTKGNPHMIKLIAKYQFPEAFDQDSDWNKDDLPTNGIPPKPPRKFEP
ncbi:hypothetical protein GC177_00825 [bacterium]|nr:hypothetical protein [bacterium]